MEKDKKIGIDSRKLRADEISNIDIGKTLKDVINLERTIKDENKEQEKEEK